MNENSPPTLYTVGHSNSSEQEFINLLMQQQITAVGDVRSVPYSRMNPQFNREHLKQVLRQKGIAYVFLGTELGARSEDLSCYEQGKVQYDRLAKTAQFHRGFERVCEGMKKFRVVLMCAERDPLECHRTILIARHFDTAGVHVKHILPDGRLESHELALNRLLRLLGLPERDMFRSRAELISEAYKQQAERIAYEKKDLSVHTEQHGHTPK